MTEAALKPEASLGYMVNHVARLYARALGKVLSPHGIQPGQFPALLALWQQDGQTQTELAGRTQIEQPTMAATLARMERDGLIYRAPHPDDRRAQRILLTPRARALQAPLTAVARRINERSAARLTSIGEAQLLSALHDVAASLSQDDDDTA